MVKKKGKNLPVQDSLDAEPVCKHLRKGLEEGTVKRALVNVEWTVCQDCQVDSKGKNDSEDELAEDPSVWLCLKCGHRGCGRNSVQQHALNHYNTPRSEPHCLVLNVDMWSAWCYLCDNEVPYNRSSRLGQLVDHIQKKSKPKDKNTNSVALDQEMKNVNVLDNDVNIQKERGKPEGSDKGDKAASIQNNCKDATVKGLSNLGNTCFFNSVMQNLSQTPALRELLNEVSTCKKTITLQLPDSSSSTNVEVHLEQQPGPLTLAMWQFLTEMQDTKKGVVTPKELFNQVCKKAVRFKGYQQQDSQELLRYLLDGMRGEEVQRISLAMCKALHGTSEEEEVKKKVKECEKRRVIPNFVDCLFGGELTSTIMCEECHTVSLVHEPFLDLSLPVLDDLLVKKNCKPTPFAPEQKEEEEDDDRYVKERNESSSGPSKHLQKKAKKAAKKQAKNQRRQQKLQDKTLQFTDLANCKSDGEENIADSSGGLGGNSQKEDGTVNDFCLKETPSPNQENVGTKLEGGTEGGTEDSTVISDNTKNVKNMEENIVEDSTEPEYLIINTEQDNVKMTPDTSTGLIEDDVCASDEDLMDNHIETLNDHFSPCTEDELTNSLNRLRLSHSVEPTDIEIEIVNDPEKSPEQLVYEVVNEDPSTSFLTLSDRKDLLSQEFSVLSCLYQFTQKESLIGNNQLLCNICTRKEASRPKNNNNNNKVGEKKFVYTNAKKQMLVSDPPPILTLHLKRFQQNGFNLRKINRHIKFPEVLDLAPFCTVKCKNIQQGESMLLYSLYGVIEHSGSMRSGHYTAFVKLRKPNLQLCELVLQGTLPEATEKEPGKGSWYHVSDSHVQSVTLSRVLSSQAYLLFYERIL
ncbi:hypothetical protein GDO86_002790 [Hymenochirus boettgeri]|uniref:Ubiquitin carboxyl-terminal hydrolase n=1 Tax=Hymenochirus boettgeri TaxID=247094 RepID=A0A8T2JYK2_9PIPI|nr:hypothetical protein GDO86_002790 [Hymenochirus boettgeri]